VTTLYADLETYSPVPINYGTWAYAEQAEVMLFAYAIDDDPPQCWDMTDWAEMPDDLRAALEDPTVTVVGHNWGNFDNVVLTVTKFTHRPELDRVVDTMVQALSHSLPPGLEKLSEVLGVPQDKAKIKDGKRLINLFCKPRPKNMKLRRATRETHPEDWEKFIEYAKNDIEAMRWAYKKMPRWNYPDNAKERALWLLDQEINHHGVHIDLDLVKAALAASDRIKDQLADEADAVTSGAVESTAQRDALLRFLRDVLDVELPDLRASTVEAFLESGYHGSEPDLPEPILDLLRNRLAATKISTAKYLKILRATSSDGYLRGLLQFNGASRTGRWAGRTVQPQNFPRPAKRITKAWEETVQAVKDGAIDLLDPAPMEALSSILRGVFLLDAGAVADLANIEGRMLAWVAGEEWKLEAFREYDAGTGHDLYNLAYARSFRIQVEEVGDEQRQVGKVQELALGYQGGVGAFVTFAGAYSIDLDDLADRAWDGIPAVVRADAEGFLKWLYKRAEGKHTERMGSDWDEAASLALLEEAKAKARQGLSERAWIVCDSLKRLWRGAHPQTELLWAGVEGMVRAAIRDPGTMYYYRRVAAYRSGNWLRVRLPSGRYLCYPNPVCGEDGQISYLGINQYSRKWQRLKTYGGKLVENIVQALARDVLAEGMLAAHAAGARIGLTVHDEIIASGAPLGVLVASMIAAPEWAEDLPLAAKGFEGPRYRKD
jgi:DNA polymerase bacteriophage-type